MFCFAPWWWYSYWYNQVLLLIQHCLCPGTTVAVTLIVTTVVTSITVTQALLAVTAAVTRIMTVVTDRNKTKLILITSGIRVWWNHCRISSFLCVYYNYHYIMRGTTMSRHCFSKWHLIPTGSCESKIFVCLCLAVCHSSLDFKYTWHSNSL